MPRDLLGQNFALALNAFHAVVHACRSVLFHCPLFLRKSGRPVGSIVVNHEVCRGIARALLPATIDNQPLPGDLMTAPSGQLLQAEWRWTRLRNRRDECGKYDGESGAHVFTFR